jgi:vacuolar iron transporter family protein
VRAKPWPIRAILVGMRRRRHAADELQTLRDQHTVEAVRKRLGAPNHSYLRDFIYGAIDGIVTTFAVVAGAAGAGLETRIVVILGTANLIADGFSMSVSNFLGSRAEQQQRERAQAEEEHQIELLPEGEREEIRQIFAGKGLEGDLLESVVAVITADRERWVSTMLTEELGYAPWRASPLRAAATTFAAFVALGSLPLLVFILHVATGVSVGLPFLWSAVLTAAAFFLVGTLKSRFVEQHWSRAGGETLLMGGAAAALAYLVGVALQNV